MTAATLERTIGMLVMIYVLSTRRCIGLRVSDIVHDLRPFSGNERATHMSRMRDARTSSGSFMQLLSYENKIAGRRKARIGAAAA
jgi:hypothetical protein